MKLQWVCLYCLSLQSNSTPVYLALCLRLASAVHLQSSLACWLLTEFSQTGYTRCRMEGSGRQFPSLAPSSLPAQQQQGHRSTLRWPSSSRSWEQLPHIGPCSPRSVMTFHSVSPCPVCTFVNSLINSSITALACLICFLPAPWLISVWIWWKL